LSFFRKSEDQDVDPLDDIIEGVDIIGTMINDMLPQIVDDLAEMRGRLEEIDEASPSEQTEPADTAGQFADLGERLELLEQRFLAHEQTSLDRYSDLRENLDEIKMALAALHDRLDNLTSRQEEIDR
jgi:predicted  nucleic acid-binding Zn-ribbon protein